MSIHMPTNEEIEAYERLEANRWTCACGYSSLADPCSGCGKPRPAPSLALLPDPSRVGRALDLLRLVEAVMREKLGPIIIGEYAPGEWEITLHDDIGQDCPRLFGEDLAQAVSATAAALEEQREMERTDCRIEGGGA